jgi:hypothetical protein
MRFEAFRTALSSGFMDAIRQLASVVGMMRTDIDGIRSSVARLSYRQSQVIRRRTFPAKITSWTPYSGDSSPYWRWRYGWQEVRPNYAGTPKPTWVTFTGSRSSTRTADQAATNGMEYGNVQASSSAGYGGPGILMQYQPTGNYPPDYKLVPIGGTYLTTGDTGAASYEVVVDMHEETDDTGVYRYWFSMANAHDGPCPE